MDDVDDEEVEEVNLIVEKNARLLCELAQSDEIVWAGVVLVIPGEEERIELELDEDGEVVWRMGEQTSAVVLRNDGTVARED